MAMMSFSAFHRMRMITSFFQRRSRTPRRTLTAIALLSARCSRTAAAVFETGYLTEIFTDRGIQFLERHRNQPFFSAHGVQLGPYLGA